MSKAYETPLKSIQRDTSHLRTRSNITSPVTIVSNDASIQRSPSEDVSIPNVLRRSGSSELSRKKNSRKHFKTYEDGTMSDEGDTSRTSSPTRSFNMRKYKIIENDRKFDDILCPAESTLTRAEKAKKVIESMYDGQKGTSLSMAYSPQQFNIPNSPLRSSQSSQILMSRSLPEDETLLRSRSTEHHLNSEEESSKKGMDSPSSLKIRRKKKKARSKEGSEEQLYMPVRTVESPKENINSTPVKNVTDEPKFDFSSNLKRIQKLNNKLIHLTEGIDRLESTSSLLQNQIDFSKQIALNTGMLISDSSVKVSNTLDYLKQSSASNSPLLSLLSVLILIIGTLVWLFCALERVVAKGCMKLFYKMKSNKEQDQGPSFVKQKKVAKIAQEDMPDNLEIEKKSVEEDIVTKDQENLLEELEEMSLSIKSLIHKDRVQKKFL